MKEYKVKNMRFVLFKYIGAIRSVLYKRKFKYIGGGGYIAKPLLVTGAESITVGDKVRIMPGMRIEAINGQIDIGNDVSIAQNFHIASGG